MSIKNKIFSDAYKQLERSRRDALVTARQRRALLSSVHIGLESDYILKLGRDFLHTVNTTTAKTGGLTQRKIFDIPLIVDDRLPPSYFKFCDENGRIMAEGYLA